MDSQTFDRLTQAILSAHKRRDALGFLAALMAASVAALLPRHHAHARGNGAGGGGSHRKRKRRAARRRRHRKDSRNHAHRRACKSTAQVCGGKCGLVTTTCKHRKKTVDCGPCACDPLCPVCLSCDAVSRTCQPDSTQRGMNCGEPGQICQADGSCACDSSSCVGTAPICVNGVCTACSDAHQCANGCCAADGSCQAGDARDACGPTGGTCDVCAGDEVCSAEKACVVPCGAPGAICRVFVTSTLRRGDFGGLAGADQVCQERATDTGLTGTYMAWLSDATGSPSTRFTRAQGPYQLVNGTTIADNWDELSSGSLIHAINIDERGDALPDPTALNDVWTATTPGGVRYTIGDIVVDCESWTEKDFDHFGALGTSTLSDVNWTEAGFAITCATRNRLYCFQQS